MKDAVDGKINFNFAQNNTKIYQQLDDSDPIISLQESDIPTSSKIFLKRLQAKNENLIIEQNNNAKNIVSNTIINEDRRKIFIQKFPGKLFIALDSIEKLNLEPNSHIFLKVLLNDKIILTNQFTESSFIKINQFITVPLSSIKKSNFEIKIFLNVFCEGKNDLKFETVLKFNQNMIEKLHNKLEEIKSNWSLISNNSFKSIFNKMLFRSNKTEALLRSYCSFLSDQELTKSPENLLDLCKWIMIRKYSCVCLFEGILNLKGVNGDYRWFRRYVKWYGYTIYIFDINTQKYIEQISLLDSIPILESIKKNIFKFHKNLSEVEIHCETQETLLSTMEAICTIFPKVLNWI